MSGIVAQDTIGAQEHIVGHARPLAPLFRPPFFSFRLLLLSFLFIWYWVPRRMAADVETGESVERWIIGRRSVIVIERSLIKVTTGKEKARNGKEK